MKVFEINLVTSSLFLSRDRMSDMYNEEPNDARMSDEKSPFD